VLFFALFQTYTSQLALFLIEGKIEKRQQNIKTMGQYYHAVVLPPTQSKKAEIIAAFNPLKCVISSKLMGHSYIGDPFTETVESHFLPGEKFHKHCLVWAGDYADPEKGCKQNLYDLARKKFIDMRHSTVPALFRYLVNHSKQLYLDKTKQAKDEYGDQIHPLPLLTCEGNGQGGGDYFTEDEHLLQHIGSWARDIISVEAEIPAGYNEIIVSF
jgi:hypothetical protein